MILSISLVLLEILASHWFCWRKYLIKRERPLITSDIRVGRGFKIALKIGHYRVWLKVGRWVKNGQKTLNVINGRSIRCIHISRQHIFGLFMAHPPRILGFKSLTEVLHFLDYDISDSGLECENSCGQEGLIDGRYWCYTFDSWDFCDTKRPGKI